MQLSLFSPGPEAKPICSTTYFPLHRRAALVRATALRLISPETGTRFWKKHIAKMRGKLRHDGLKQQQINAEMRAYKSAVNAFVLGYKKIPQIENQKRSATILPLSRPRSEAERCPEGSAGANATKPASRTTVAQHLH
ncbi:MULTISPECIES: DUF6074 family protein [unclassified Mesorhizobium]|uniref:DUF6074 family protein n=1 Tax=unclassified Mesorhizobium TaxID=325217 RepID=UPI0003CDEB24|nr:MULTISPECIES: DUF6074 family protein [unclassified Mesorhizobium]ESY03243.1 hypothetical protein X753_24090 [Mesorhizobium sp. LNJC399B00]WJI69378.1 DUF6074 family protein [Mesorhizobium sp. C399B]